MMTGMGGGMIAMMIAAWVFYLALLILVVLCIVWLVRDLRRRSTTSPNGHRHG
jgi:uncharacterized membrane protein